MRQVSSMKFEEACEKALDYFRKEYNDSGLRSARDLKESWLFEGANEDGVVVYGKQDVTIDKKSGELDLFYLPNEENFKRLDEAVKIELPEKYRINV